MRPAQPRSPASGQQVPRSSGGRDGTWVGCGEPGVCPCWAARSLKTSAAARGPAGGSRAHATATASATLPGPPVLRVCAAACACRGLYLHGRPGVPAPSAPASGLCRLMTRRAGWRRSPAANPAWTTPGSLARGRPGAAPKPCLGCVLSRAWVSVAVRCPARLWSSSLAPRPSRSSRVNRPQRGTCCDLGALPRGLTGSEASHGRRWPKYRPRVITASDGSEAAVSDPFVSELGQGPSTQAGFHGDRVRWAGGPEPRGPPQRPLHLPLPAPDAAFRHRRGAGRVLGPSVAGQEGTVVLLRGAGRTSATWPARTLRPHVST